MSAFSLGLSPCPNDTFIFHALLHGLVRAPEFDNLDFAPHMADVEQLNNMAIRRELMATKISLGVMPYIRDDYCLLATGAALGWGCGPLVVARRGLDAEKLEDASVAIPGAMTTANLLLNLTGKFHGPRLEMLFSEIIPAVARGDVDLGVIIHEGRFTYQNYDLIRILDLGEWWEHNFHLPLPLGAIAVRRDIEPHLAKTLQALIGASLRYARNNPQASEDFVARNAQELSADVTRAHIETFVTEYSLDLGETGRKAVEILIEAAQGPGATSLPIFLE